MFSASASASPNSENAMKNAGLPCSPFHLLPPT